MAIHHSLFRDPEGIHSLLRFAIVLIALCYHASGASAQVRFTGADNPIPGQRSEYSIASTEGFSPGSGGSNVTWDFSSIVLGANSARSVVSREQLPMAMQTAFPTATFGIVDDTTTYLCAPTTRSIRVIGIVSPRTVTNLAEPNNPYETRPTEFTQNQIHNDQFVGTVFFPTMQGTTVATANTVFDGVGTLFLNVLESPFRNVKRTVTRIARSDAFTINMRNVLQQTVTVRYDWYPERGSLPLVEYKVDTIRLFANGRLIVPPVVLTRLLVTSGEATTFVDGEFDPSSLPLLVLRPGQRLPFLTDGQGTAVFISLHGAISATVEASSPFVPHIPYGAYAVDMPAAIRPSRRIILVAP